MLVILNYLDGDCEVIHYERKRLETYLSQQIKSTSDFEKMDFIRIEWGMHHELVIPKGTKVNRFLRNRLDCHVDKDGGVILLPCITLQICEDEEAWIEAEKDIRELAKVMSNVKRQVAIYKIEEMK